ncbi:hypothetical protein DJ524_05760 [Sulfolobus sp. D5]|nr:hypothetical protein DJ524_05760 [Sulfolobus sp. D5]
MLLPILIAILSVIEGLDPYKGLLFSYYFYKFNKVRESYLVPVVSSMSYYALGILITLMLLNALIVYNISILKIIIFYLLITHAIIKVLMGKVLHYTGSMKPFLINVVKWAIVNSIIQMNLILILSLSIFFKLAFIILVSITTITRELIFLLTSKINHSILINLTKFNFDYIYSFLVVLLAIVIIVLR